MNKSSLAWAIFPQLKLYLGAGRHCPRLIHRAFRTAQVHEIVSVLARLKSYHGFDVLQGLGSNGVINRCSWVEAT